MLLACEIEDDAEGAEGLGEGAVLLRLGACSPAERLEEVVHCQRDVLRGVLPSDDGKVIEETEDNEEEVAPREVLEGFTAAEKSMHGCYGAERHAMKVGEVQCAILGALHQDGGVLLVVFAYG